MRLFVSTESITSSQIKNTPKVILIPEDTCLSLIFDETVFSVRKVLPYNLPPEDLQKTKGFSVNSEVFTCLSTNVAKAELIFENETNNLTIKCFNDEDKHLSTFSETFSVLQQAVVVDYLTQYRMDTTKIENIFDSNFIKNILKLNSITGNGVQFNEDICYSQDDNQIVFMRIIKELPKLGFGSMGVTKLRDLGSKISGIHKYQNRLVFNSDKTQTAITTSTLKTKFSDLVPEEFLIDENTQGTITFHSNDFMQFMTKTNFKSGYFFIDLVESTISYSDKDYMFMMLITYIKTKVPVRRIKISATILQNILKQFKDCYKIKISFVSSTLLITIDDMITVIVWGEIE